jgi:hypothetical protein
MFRGLAVVVLLVVGIALTPTQSVACWYCITDVPCAFCFEVEYVGLMSCDYNGPCDCREGGGTCTGDEDAAFDASAVAESPAGSYSDGDTFERVRMKDGSIVILDCGGRVVDRILSTRRVKEIRQLTERINI